MIQVSGSALRLPAFVLKQNFDRLHYLREALIRYNLLLLRHAVISTSCSQFHSGEQRLAPWLVAQAHRTGLEAFPFGGLFGRTSGPKSRGGRCPPEGISKAGFR
jgi:hypothetical protein